MNFKVLPNILSILRFPLSILFAYYFHNMLTTNQFSSLVLMIFIVLILTDFFDGLVARSLNCESSIGSYLDVFADFFFVFSAYLVLVLSGHLNIFFIAVLLVKFIEFLLTSIIYDDNEYSVLLFDKLGMNVSKFWMCFPGLISLLYILEMRNLDLMINGVMLITSIIALLSTITRIINMRRN